LLVYVPPLPPTSSGKAKLTMTDEDGVLLGQTNLTIPLQGGVIAFPVPSSVLPLQDRTIYQWVLQIPCRQTVGEGDPTTEGIMGYQAVPPNLIAPQKTIQAQLRQIDELAAAGYWLDAVMATANLLNNASIPVREKDLIPRLNTLLKQEGLDSIAPYFLN
jgi:hypothetical protein